MTQTFRFSAIIKNDRYEDILGQLITLGMLGCEELIVPEGLKITPYFKDKETAEAAISLLDIRNTSDNISVEPVEQQDWNAKWRATMKPARLARGYWVSPVWLPPPDTAKHWIKIEPKMAFGTGHHETTRLAASAIISQKRGIKGRQVLDIGTGSGVLCFVADRCGAALCIGAEIDPCCRENLAENLEQNLPAGNVSFLIGSTNALKTASRFDCVVMNMLITESSPLLGAVASMLKPGGFLIWSGILTDERSEAVDFAEKTGFMLVSEKSENEWWCGVYRRVSLDTAREPKGEQN
jgi:ribosomal protein L11 methyltransferase